MGLRALDVKEVDDKMIILYVLYVVGLVRFMNMIYIYGKAGSKIP
jgi:hypothetical protein